VALSQDLITVRIGRDAVIMPGVTIGDGAIIGARAVVGPDVPP
jgi:virginiamycin A acetyltransferase